MPSYHVFKNEEEFIVFPDNLIQFYDIGMIQFTKSLPKARLSVKYTDIHNTHT